MPHRSINNMSSHKRPCDWLSYDWLSHGIIFWSYANCFMFLNVYLFSFYKFKHLTFLWMKWTYNNMNVFLLKPTRGLKYAVLSLSWAMRGWRNQHKGTFARRPRHVVHISAEAQQTCHCPVCSRHNRSWSFRPNAQFTVELASLSESVWRLIRDNICFLISLCLQSRGFIHSNVRYVTCTFSYSCAL